MTRTVQGAGARPGRSAPARRPKRWSASRDGTATLIDERVVYSAAMGLPASSGRHAGEVALFVAGLMMTLLGVFAESRDAIAATLVAFGAALMALAVLLQRLEGPVKISPTGLEAVLAKAVSDEAEAKGLPPAITREAVAAVQNNAERAVRDWAAELLVRVEEHASVEGLTSIPVTEFQEAMRDPRIRGLLASTGETQNSPEADPAS